MWEELQQGGGFYSVSHLQQTQAELQLIQHYLSVAMVMQNKKDVSQSRLYIYKYQKA